MQAAIARDKGKTVPAQIGRAAGSQRCVRRGRTRRRTTRPGAGQHHAAEVVGGGLDDAGGSSVPVPLLVLGGLAVLLTAVGAVGVIAKRRRL